MVEITNYTDLEITSARLPENTHLIWELNSGGIYIVDDDDNTKIYYSADKGDNWALIDTRTQKIQMAWHDRPNEIIWFVDCDNPGNDYQVWTLDYSGSESSPSITEVGDGASGADAGTVYIMDIFQISTDHFVIYVDQVAGDNFIYIYNINSAPFVEKTTIPTLAVSITENWYGVVYEITEGDLTGNWYQSFLIWQGALYPFLYWYETETLFSITNDLTGYSMPSDINVRGVSYTGGVASGNVFSVATKDADGLNYLISWNVSDLDWTVRGLAPYAQMLDRNTKSADVLEKAYHLTLDKMYQLSSTRHQLYQFSGFDFPDTIIAITDTYVVCAGGEMFQGENLIGFVYEFDVLYGSMRIPSAIMICTNQILISPGMMITAIDTFTNAGDTSIVSIFEGYVEPFIEQKLQEILLVSPAIELKRIKPEGDYTGRIDEIMVSLIADYCGYVTSGTLSAGTELGQIHFNGDKSLFQIFHEFALTDKFIWSLTPVGVLDYNDGTVDSTINIDETDNMTVKTRRKGDRAINDVKIKGSIGGGDQATGDGAENTEDKNLNGINPFARTISHLTTNALCIATEDNVLLRWGTQPTLIEFTHYDPTIGLIQAAQTITFQNNKIDPNISSDQYFIHMIIYDALNQFPTYTISDAII